MAYDNHNNSYGASPVDPYDTFTAQNAAANLSWFVQWGDAGSIIALSYRCSNWLSHHGFQGDITQVAYGRLWCRMCTISNTTRYMPHSRGEFVIAGVR